MRNKRLSSLISISLGFVFLGGVVEASCREIAYYSQCTDLGGENGAACEKGFGQRCGSGEEEWAVSRWCQSSDSCSGSSLGLDLNEIWVYCCSPGDSPYCAVCGSGGGDEPPPPPDDPPEIFPAPWFTTFKGGVLSGSADVGITDQLPDLPSEYSLPKYFDSEVVIPGPNVKSPRPDVGTLISSGLQDVAVVPNAGTTDASALTTGNVYNLSTFSSILSDVDIEEIKSSGLIVNCANMLLLPKLSPSVVYKVENLTCLETGITSLGSSGEYELASDGLVVILAEKEDSNSVLEIKNPFRSKSSNSEQRVLFITDAKIEIGFGVGTKPALFDRNSYYADTEPHIQAAFLTFNNGPAGIEVIDRSVNPIQNRAVIMEGPITALKDIILGRGVPSSFVDETVYPGVYVKYNPFYIAELSKTPGLLPGFSKPTITWRYE